MDDGFGTSGVWLVWSCSNFKWLMILENVVEGSLEERMGESRAVSLTGNEGATRGGLVDDMMAFQCCSVAPVKGCESKNICDRSKSEIESRCLYFFVT